MVDAVESEDAAAGGGVGRDVVVARVTSRQKLWRRDFILFSEEETLERLEGAESWRKTSEGMPSSSPALNIYSKSNPPRAQSAVLLLYKEATIVNLHNSETTHVLLLD